MTELISTLVLFINETLLYWVPALVLLGYAVKHCTGFPNQLIPLVEVSGGALIGIFFGLVTSGGNILDIIMYAGQGALLGVIAIALYDLVHGAIKEWKARQSVKNKEEK